MKMIVGSSLIPNLLIPIPLLRGLEIGSGKMVSGQLFLPGGGGGIVVLWFSPAIEGGVGGEGFRWVGIFGGGVLGGLALGLGFGLDFGFCWVWI